MAALRPGAGDGLLIGCRWVAELAWSFVAGDDHGVSIAGGLATAIHAPWCRKSGRRPLLLKENSERARNHGDIY